MVALLAPHPILIETSLSRAFLLLRLASLGVPPSEGLLTVSAQQNYDRAISPGRKTEPIRR